MKKICLLLVFSIMFSVMANGQKIVKKEVDKFTKAEIIETSNETLYSVNYLASGYIYQFEFNINKTDSTYNIAADILLKDIEKYTEDSGVIFLLDNDETVVLKTNYTGIGGKPYANGYYFSTSFTLSSDDVKKLKQHKVTNVRINYLGGHYDKELKGKKQELIKKMLDLIGE